MNDDRYFVILTFAMGFPTYSSTNTSNRYFIGEDCLILKKSITQLPKALTKIEADIAVYRWKSFSYTANIEIEKVTK